MKKDGFVFIESIVVLVVVALSLTMLISSYSLVSRKTKEKEHYNKASDKYLLYSISTLGTNDMCNYSISCNSLSHKEISFRADRTSENNSFSCNVTKIGEILNDCENFFKQMNIVHIYVVEDIIGSLNSSSANTLYDNGTIEFMKSLKKCNDIDSYTNKKTCSDPIKYMMGVFERGNNEYYYASIEI